MVDGGGGNTIFKQLKSAGINWKSIRHIFITHKHMDHLFGIMWFVRMICQHINRNTYEGEAYIYGHDEVIKIIRDIAIADSTITEYLLPPGLKLNTDNSIVSHVIKKYIIKLT